MAKRITPPIRKAAGTGKPPKSPRIAAVRTTVTRSGPMQKQIRAMNKRLGSR